MNKYIFGGKSTEDVKCEGTTDAKQYETTADAESEKKSESGIGSIQDPPALFEKLFISLLVQVQTCDDKLFPLKANPMKKKRSSYRLRKPS